MKRNLLVTLADRNYLDQAKQLFSSVYFNAGWKGDYMLLAHDVPEKDLKWFIDKGILIKHCKPLYQGQVGGMAAVLTSKFYLFTPEFKKWDNIIYLDGDIIVRAPLDELAEVEGFSAVPDLGNSKLSGQFVNRKLINPKYVGLFRQLKQKYDLKLLSFNAGVFAFNTKVIGNQTFDQLNYLVEQYAKIIQYGDQPIFNLCFYKEWEKLPAVYNIYVTGNRNLWHLKPEKIKGIIIHFITYEKPWLNKNYFYKEWKTNLVKASEIDLHNISSGRKWTKEQINDYSKYLDRRYVLFYLYYFIDGKIGLIGIFLKRYFPRIYHILKSIKENKKI